MEVRAFIILRALEDRVFRYSVVLLNAIYVRYRRRMCYLEAISVVFIYYFGTFGFGN